MRRRRPKIPEYLMRENELQAEAVKQYRKADCLVYVTSQRMGSTATEGIPDLYIVPPEGNPWWHEVKSKGAHRDHLRMLDRERPESKQEHRKWRRAKAQEAFRDAHLDTPVLCYMGGLRVVIESLHDHELTLDVPQPGVPGEPPGDLTLPPFVPPPGS